MKKNKLKKGDVVVFNLWGEAFIGLITFSHYNWVIICYSENKHYGINIKSVDIYKIGTI